MGRGCEAEAIALDRSFDKVAVIFIFTCYFQSELLLKKHRAMVMTSGRSIRLKQPSN